MNTFRARIHPRSAARSPWQADTLFGQLCWLVRHEQGADALAGLLARYRAGDPPLLFSDGCPEGWLPRPLGLPAGSAAPGEWVTEAAFEALRCGDTPATFGEPNFRAGRLLPKLRVNRLSDDQPDDDGRYLVEELVFAERQIDHWRAINLCVYVRAADDAWAAQARAWLERLALDGYGAGKSAGYGQFALAGWEPWPAFDRAPPQANGFISLANWVPARDDPTDGSYATLVKYGKLGEELAASANPFKYPLLMLAAGSCFRATRPARPWYGRLVEQIAALPDIPIVQYGYAFAVPARLPAPGE